MGLVTTEDALSYLVALLRVRPVSIWEEGEIEFGEVAYFLNEYEVWNKQVQGYLESAGLEKVQGD